MLTHEVYGKLGGLAVALPGDKFVEADRTVVVGADLVEADARFGTTDPGLKLPQQLNELGEFGRRVSCPRALRRIVATAARDGRKVTYAARLGDSPPGALIALDGAACS